MSGGLIQLVITGEQDSALTYNPEITFFKKLYRRHTKFSLELKEVSTEQEQKFGDKISFNLTNGDLIHRCFIQIDLPALLFDDSTIKTNEYILWKNNNTIKLNKNVEKWFNDYNNFKNYASIELTLYKQLIILFLSEKITLNSIKSCVLLLNNINIKRSQYIKLIDTNILDKVNISKYISSLNKILTYNNPELDKNNISIYTIKNRLSVINNNIQKYLQYYHTNWKDALKLSQKLSNIKFAWTQYIGHYYFTQFELDIGGQITEYYSSDQLHIYQYHHLKEEQIKNYNIMIGHDIELYEYSANGTPLKTLLIPLLFYFNKNVGSALPLIAMRNTNISISLKINKLRNLIYFRDWEDEYNNLTVLSIEYNNSLNNNLNFNKYTYDTIKEKIIYNLDNINYTALELIYPELLDTEIDFILDNFGINKVLCLNEWIYFKNNLYKHPLLHKKLDIIDKNIDYNYLLSKVPDPNVKLLTECIYLDEIERHKFCSSKLEYIIEGFQENVFDVDNKMIFNGEISINRPNKYFKWFIQPKNFLYGLTEYGKVTPYLFNYSNYYTNKIFERQIITLNQIEILNEQLDNKFYNLVQSNKLLNRTLLDNVYFYTFSLYPEEQQPSGTANLSVIKEKKIKYIMNQNFLTEYTNSLLNPNNVGLQLKILSSCYSLFVVHKSVARIIF